MLAEAAEAAGAAGARPVAGVQAEAGRVVAMKAMEEPELDLLAVKEVRVSVELTVVAVQTLEAIETVGAAKVVRMVAVVTAVITNSVDTGDQTAVYSVEVAAAPQAVVPECYVGAEAMKAGATATTMVRVAAVHVYMITLLADMEVQSVVVAAAPQVVAPEGYVGAVAMEAVATGLPVTVTLLAETEVYLAVAVEAPPVEVRVGFAHAAYNCKSQMTANTPTRVIEYLSHTYTSHTRNHSRIFLL